MASIRNKRSTARLASLWRGHGTELVLLGAIGGVLILFSRFAPGMLTSNNLVSILRQMSFIAIAGLGITFVIISGRIDLSVGSTITVASTTMALLVTRHGVPSGVALVLPVLIGMMVGMINGLLTTKARVTSVIATLGTLIALDGAAKLIVGGETIAGLPKVVTYLGSSKLGPVPVSVFVMLFVWFGAEFTLRKTSFGRNCYHIGSNEQAASLNGIAVDRYVTWFFMTAGALSGLAALILVGRLRSANVDIGVGLELQAIAVAVIGGGSLFGGKGTATGTVFAVGLMAVINSGMRLSSVNVYWQTAVTGALIVVAVSIDAIRRRGDRS
ncbi:MAG: ABC transporter permease [Acidimicrobiales bacterium]|nr:ABC transporter permease [Acidimicrobiales bacterium]